MSGTASYDVFDTVVTRDFAHPRDLFVHLGAHLRERGAHRLDALGFARARWAAELAARKQSPQTEVVLDDIYRALAQRLGWDEATTRGAQALELEIESRHLHAVPLMLPVLAATRDRVGRLVFLSDMYLPSAVLRTWLAREGVLAPQDLLLISGEARANKNSGALYLTAQRETGGTFAQWHHAGDHPFADVAKPRQLGIAATHLTQAHLTGRERQARGSSGEFAEVWRSLLAGAMRLARLERAPATEREAVLWETGTSAAGPLFYGFVRWTLHEARRRGLRRLYFLARDGQIFARIAEAIQAAEPGPVECRYLLASRLLFAGAAELDSPGALRLLVAPNGQFHSLRQALLPVGLDEAWAAAHLPARFRSFAFGANLPPAEREALADWLLAPAQRAELHAALDQRSTQARAYLTSIGLGPGEPVALVDTGWFGTIQRSLEHVLGGGGQPVPLTGFYLGVMPPGTPAITGETHGYTNRFSPLPLLREESHKVLVELMAQSDHGQVTGLVERNGQWTVQLQDAGPVNLAEIRLFQDAVLAFTCRALATAREAAPPEPEFARAVIGLYRNLHDHPTAREVQVLGFLPHSDQYFEQHHATLCAELGLRATLVAIANYRRRPPHWWVAGQAVLGHSLLLHTFRVLKKLWWRLAGRHE